MNKLDLSCIESLFVWSTYPQIAEKCYTFQEMHFPISMIQSCFLWIMSSTKATVIDAWCPSKGHTYLKNPRSWKLQVF